MKFDESSFYPGSREREIDALSFDIT
jgi:hypothetical protein